LELYIFFLPSFLEKLNLILSYLFTKKSILYLSSKNILNSTQDIKEAKIEVMAGKYGVFELLKHTL